MFESIGGKKSVYLRTASKNSFLLVDSVCFHDTEIAVIHKSTGRSYKCTFILELVIFFTYIKRSIKLNARQLCTELFICMSGF